MPIEITDYRDEWPKRFLQEARRIQRALGPIVIGIEHVGSTAVPGLAAKDTVDIQISIDGFKPEARFRTPLQELGYVFRSDDEPQHRFFKLEDEAGRRLVNVHVCETGSDWERRHIAFRDHLRRNSETASAYERLKRKLAPRFDDVNEYADAKGAFIAAVVDGSETSSLHTDRLVLRRMDGSTRPHFARLARDPNVTRFLGDGSTWSDERIEEVFTWVLAHWDEQGFGWRAAFDRETDEFVGFIGLNYVGPEATEIPDKDEVEIGWWIDPAFWGRGFATEGARSVRDEAFARVGLDRIIGRHQKANPASGRIMEKLGMTFEREAVGRHGDVVRIFILNRDRWLQLKATEQTGMR